MMIKYYASGNKVTEASIARETEKCVFKEIKRFTGETEFQKLNKKTENDGYFDTWEEAKQFLVDRAQGDVDRVRQQLKYYNGILGNIKGIKRQKGEK